MKTPEQVAAIEEVQRSAEVAMGEVMEYLRSSSAPTSEGAHATIDAVFAKSGCESPQGHIVAGGTQSSAPHAKGTGPIQKGEPIVIDIYPRSATTGYWADMSRTVCIGTPPARLQSMYDAVFAAQEIGMSMVKPGARCQDIQIAIEQFFINAGYVTSGEGDKVEGFPYAEGFVHGVGHGVGLEVHEAPRIGRGSEDVLAEGDVITIEPGLYYKDIGGVRLEDLGLVTAEGFRNFTRFPRQLEL